MRLKVLLILIKKMNQKN